MNQLVKAGAILFFLVLFLTFLVVGASLPRDSDDEMIYTALAAKLQAQGPAGYNLRDVSIESDGSFWKLEIRSPGNMLAGLRQSGVDYYDTGLFFNPPLFPAALSLSHALFSHTEPFLVLKRSASRNFHPEQIYLSFPNACAAIFFLAGVYRLAKRFASEKIAALAALFCLTSPVFLVTVFKTWTDLLAAGLLVWSFNVWRTKERGTVHAALAGILFGMAVLTRTSSFLAGVIFLGKRGRDSAIWFLAALLVSGVWFYKMYAVYGNPFFFPQAAHAQETLAWMKVIRREWYFYLYDIFYLCPVFLLVFWAFKKETAVLGWWIAVFLGALSAVIYSDRPLGLEDRYLLPSYPAWAILAALGYEKLKTRIPRRLLTVLVTAGLIWSLHIALPLIHSRESLKFIP